jgi:hypothetical protein
MITNPRAGTPSEAGWAMGFVFGFMSPNFTDPLPAVIAPDLVDAFNEGRLEGQRGAIEGLPLIPECRSATEDAPESASEIFVKGTHLFEFVTIGFDLAKRHILGAFAGALVLLLEFGIPQQSPIDPREGLASLGRRFQAALAVLGITDGDFFMAVGVDAAVAGCEIRFSHLFKSFDQAKQAALAMGRDETVVAHWQLAALGVLEVIDVP